MKTPDIFRYTPAVFLKALLLCLFVSLALIQARNLAWLQSWDLSAYDVMVAEGARDDIVDEHVVLVTITENDIQSLAQWPIIDQTLAGLVKAVQAYSPAAIGIDIYRDKLIPPGSDELANTLKDHSHIYLVEKFSAGDKETGIQPHAGLLAGHRTGFSDVVIDGDGIVRRGLLFLSNADRLAYALSLRLAMHYLAGHNIALSSDPDDPEKMRLGEVTYTPLEQDDGGYVGLDSSGYQYLLSMKRVDASFPVVTMAQLMKASINLQFLKGKVVIIGVVSESVKDAFFTPLSKGNIDIPSTAGVVLHAHMTSQLIRSALDREKPLSVVSNGWENVWIIIWAFVGLVMAMLANALMRYVVGIPLGLVVLAFSTYGIFVAGIWLPLAAASVAFLLSFLLVSGLVYIHEKRQRDTVMDLFSRHVSQEVAEEVWLQRDVFIKDGRIKARQTIATIMFTDLVGYTSTAEKMGVEALMTWLNNYMEVMAECVFRHGGTIDDYLGDAIKADFGVLEIGGISGSIQKNARAAVDCALEMNQELKKLNHDRTTQGLPPIGMRVGIATGPVIAGSLGSKRRLKYTTIGDTVNIAARLESYGRELSRDEDEYCTITIAESTFDYLDGRVGTAYLGEIFLKGKEQGLKAYKLTYK